RCCDPEAGPCCVPTPAQQGSNAACLACESDPIKGCPELLNSCDLFSTESLRNACNAVLTCARITNCGQLSTVDCLCGAGDLTQSVEGSPSGLLGPCVNEIRAGLPGIPDSLLFTNIADYTTPPGAALTIVLCDELVCPDSCFPYCAP